MLDGENFPTAILVQFSSTHLLSWSSPWGSPSWLQPHAVTSDQSLGQHTSTALTCRKYTPLGKFRLSLKASARHIILIWQYLNSGRKLKDGSWWKREGAALHGNVRMNSWERNWQGDGKKYHRLEFSCDGTGGTVTSLLLLSLPLMLCVSLRDSSSTSQKCKLEKNDCLTPRDGVVRVDGLIYTALCTCQELLMGTPGNVPGTSRAKRKSCHSLNERCHLGTVSNYDLFVETTTAEGFALLTHLHW